ncbi:hypothetical protein VTK26DRAFT_5755 [Humicola hyalothermophila]
MPQRPQTAYLLRQEPLPKTEESEEQIEPEEPSEGEYEDKSNIQPLTLSLTRSENSILFRQEHIVQTSSVLHAPLQTAIPVQFRIGSAQYYGVILYKVINKRYLYTVVNTGGAIEKVYLLRASDFTGEAAQVPEFHRPLRELSDARGFVMNTVAMVQEGKRTICMVEGAATDNGNMWVCSVSVLKTRWSKKMVLEQVRARRKEQQQLSYI